MQPVSGPRRARPARAEVPQADLIGIDPDNSPPNTLGIRLIMFAVDDIEDVIARLRTHGAELLGEVA